jgi:biopolymer transport protein ExbD
MAGGASNSPNGGGLDGIGRGRAGGNITGINVTPLVDVVLVLLVVLMVASTYVVAQTIKVQLPKASQTDGPAEKPLKVILQASGGFLLDGAPATRAEIKSALTARIAKEPDMSLVVSADEAVAHGRVVALIDLAKQVGVRQFAINVELGSQ